MKKKKKKKMMMMIFVSTLLTLNALQLYADRTHLMLYANRVLGGTAAAHTAYSDRLRLALHNVGAEHCFATIQVSGTVVRVA